ncbi:MAG: hypothetical protein QW158_06980 [Nitrososphaerales archaeon]
MVKEFYGLRRFAAYLLYIGFGAFSTLFVLSIIAALANIPNYGAKLAGQNCACRVPNELIVYIDVGGLMLGVGLLVPTLLFSGATIYLFASRRLELSKEFKRFLSVGVLLAALIAATLLLTSSPLPEKGEATFNSINPYPLTVRLLNGSTFTTNALTGKVVVAQFFLPDCPICELQLQELKKIVNQKSVNAVFMLVVPSWSHVSLDELKMFAQNVPDKILVGFDVGTSTKEYEVDVVPIMVVLSSDRSIAFIHIGLAKDDELMDMLSKLGALRTDVKEDLLEEVKEGVVYVYVEDHLEVPLIQRLAEGFRQKYPNISVVILWPNCCGSGKTLWPVDIITGSNMSLLTELKTMGKLRVIKEAPLDYFPSWAKDNEGFWVAQGIKVDVPAYNRALLDKPPHSFLHMVRLSDLTVLGKPDYSIRSSSFVALTQLYGMDYWFSYRNSSMLVVPLLRVADILASGDRALTPFIPLSEYVRARSLNENVLYFLPEEGVFVRLSWIALAADSPHPNTGELWLRYVLSYEGQVMRQSIYFDLSARLDVGSEPYFDEILKAVKSYNVVQPEWSSYSRDLERYLTFFNELFPTSNS